MPHCLGHLEASTEGLDPMGPTSSKLLPYKTPVAWLLVTAGDSAGIPQGLGPQTDTDGDYEEQPRSLLSILGDHILENGPELEVRAFSGL